MLGQHELAPGERAELRIVYNTFKFPGKFEKFVYIDLAGEGEARQTITLTGDVDPIPMGVLEVNPRKLEAGTMALDQPVALELTMRNTGDADLRVASVLAQKQQATFFNRESDGEMIIPPGAAKTLPIKVTARQKGRFMDYLMIHSDARNDTEAGYKVVVVGQCD